jgi:uncharacterized membrane protein YedE/YeeE
MKYLRFLLLGVVFGIVLSKGEVISWYRIYEMFKFQSFHMYGIIGSAVVLGILVVQWIKRKGVKTVNGDPINFEPKNRSFIRYIVGGTIFGLGWALTGACPGPMFILLGHGFVTILVVIAAALLGTFTYGLLKDKLPH